MIHVNKRAWLAAGLLAAAGFAMAADKPAAAPAAGGEEAAVRALTTNFEKAFNSYDAKGVTALYADDAVVMPPNEPRAAGKAAFVPALTKDLAEAKKAGYTLKIDAKTDVAVMGDMAWESGVFQGLIMGKVVETGKFLSVARKKDG